MKVCVTGGGGFLGSAIVQLLRAREDEVISLSRNRHPQVEALGVRCVQADLATSEDLAKALEGVELLFHVASKTGVWGSPEEFMRVNLLGTERLLSACRAAGVPRMVYTSSPSSTFDGSDAEGLSEAECSFPSRFEAPYPESKALAEQRVLAANDKQLATTALRPHLIWGPGDPHIIPRLIARHRQGRLRRVGGGENRVAITYIDNAAAAHLQAAEVLAPGSANAGRAYFVSDDEPVMLWPWIDALLQGLGFDPISKSISFKNARRLGAALEGLWRLLPLSGEPPMTRFVALSLATSHWYDLSAARRDFNYRMVTEPAEGLKRTLASFQSEGRER